MFKSIACFAVAAATTLVASAPAQAASDHSYHDHLAGMIKQAGVSLYINHKACWEEDSFGFYISSYKAMVVCQENKTSPNVIVPWTEEDYDTLRHEAQHMIQDCMIGGLGDDKLLSVYTEPVALAQKHLTSSHIEGIINAYSDESEEVIILELEAFTVAALNDPMDQAKDIQKYCF